MKSIYVITWKYHNDNDSRYDDEGVVETAYLNEQKAFSHMRRCVNADFDEFQCDEETKPKISISEDCAKVDNGFGDYYEYKILKIDLDESEN